MKRVRIIGTWTAAALLGVSGIALADPPAPGSAKEPAGFVAGGVIGGFAAGPVGAVLGASLGTWLGNRVHRADQAAAAEARVAALETDEASARERTAKVLDGVQADVLFRTDSAELAPQSVQGLAAMAQAAKASALRVRIEGSADPRGTAAANLALSAARANTVRDVFLASGVPAEALDVSALGDSCSVATDPDGYALERRVRLTLRLPSDSLLVSGDGSRLR